MISYHFQILQTQKIGNECKSNSSPNQNQIINGISSIYHSNSQIDNQKVNVLTILRAKCEILVDLNKINLEDFEAILETSEIRNLWDNLVEKSSTIRILNSNTEITKTDFKLGWPSNQCDAPTISKTFNNSNSIINISTSLPSCSDQPAFLCSSPPFVQSHMPLIAWYIQIDSNSNQTNLSSNLGQEDHCLNDDLSSSNQDQKHLSNNNTSSSSCSSSTLIKPILTTPQITLFSKFN
ncbi:hypothetical protein O181_062779 [Austropuccinia psidii MF-1]|uniref:Uncharacterized protein n=1 Tax=Austropuccinia psidii MF-1 TaxID=1389203 RepID=A0A9Q3EKT0_9BASI|nr:hypothetical protein [Austropuccinia psidii MF-1]